MTTVLTYVLAALLIPLAVSLMLFVMAQVEDKPHSGRRSQVR